MPGEDSRGGGFLGGVPLGANGPGQKGELGAAGQMQKEGENKHPVEATAFQ